MNDTERDLAVLAELDKVDSALLVVRNSNVKADVEKAVAAAKSALDTAASLRVYPPLLVEVSQ